MITQFSCSCGNNDPSKSLYYDGAMGYEAIVCKKCGRYSDHNGEHLPDEWSKQYLEDYKALVRDNIIFQRAFEKFTNAAKELSEAWDNYTPGMEFSSYPFEEDFNTVVEKIQKWEADAVEELRDICYKGNANQF